MLLVLSLLAQDTKLGGVVKSNKLKIFEALDQTDVRIQFILPAVTGFGGCHI
jgi:hypothetical protein